ncbi:MAG: YifB family Mg chelatase-like AAA ATPase [Pseudohongiellaceae bacterium]|nr:YifB family Mg chelatase-like AAA ATPase [Pseudohongiellaceae bacterium]
MSLAVVYTRANVGIEAPLVTVETHLSNGLPGLAIVGLPEAAVRESKERVRSAILNANLEFPTRRITINLAPADLPKNSGRFDLAIALSILAASEQIPVAALAQYEVLGELALTGGIRHVYGVLPAVLAATESNRELILPSVNAQEASLVRNVKALSASHLLDVCRHLTEGSGMQACRFNAEASKPSGLSRGVDIADIKGQESAKRALLIAAAGSHNILFVGPPGTGKTMLANSLAGLLPPLSEKEALEAAAIKSIAKLPIDPEVWLEPSFRAPHHTATSVSLVGGGAQASPGEVTLAHRGVLFLDELTEFSRHVLEVLREPIESGIISICRASYRLQLPANFQLVAAMNPCHCGFAGDPSNACRCSDAQIQRYLDKISGPLLDRIDLIMTVPRVSHAELMNAEIAQSNESSEALRERVMHCRELQQQRAGRLNSDMTNREIQTHCTLDKSSEKSLAEVVDKLQLSARSCHRVLKIARTIADLEGHAKIQQQDLMEAVAYRRMESCFTHGAQSLLAKD